MNQAAGHIIIHHPSPSVSDFGKLALKTASSLPSLSIHNVDQNLLRIDGVIESNKSYLSTSDKITVEIVQQAEDQPIWYTQTSLTMNGDGNLSFSVKSPGFIFREGTYICNVKLQNETVTEKKLLISQQIKFPLVGVRSFSGAPYRSNIQINSVEIKQNFLLQIKGMVKNIGTMQWRVNDPFQPYRIGGVLMKNRFRDSATQEFRYDFLTSVINPGNEVPFHFTLNLSALEPGRYQFYIDLVRERVLWFSDLGEEGELIEFEVKKKFERAEPSDDHLLNPPNSLALNPSKAHILYIAPTLPLFDRSAGGKRLYSLFKILREQGIEITFLYEELGIFDQPEKYLNQLDQIGVRHQVDPLGFLAENKANYNLCVIGWYACAARLLSALREFLPNIRIAVDSIDIHWIRAEREAKYFGTQVMSPEQKQAEIDIYSQADEVWVVSEDDRQTLLSEIPYAKTRIIGIPSEIDRNFINDPVATDILFVGGFTHPPNESAARWAAEIVERFREKTGKQILLRIIGADPPKSIQELHDGSLTLVMGHVPDLDQYYRMSKVVLAPLRYGAGVKGKVCEAICKGLPVITTSIGNEGINLIDREEILLAEETEQFVAILEEIFQGKIKLSNFTEKARAGLLTRHGYDAIRSTLLPAIIAPSVLIAVVSYNQRDILKNALTGLFTTTTYPNFKVAVVSNGCTDGTAQMLSEVKTQYPDKLEIYINNENQFFIRPNNFLIEKYADSDIILMNNDIEILHPGWLTNLVDAAYSSAQIAASGGKLLDRLGLISEAGAEIYYSGFGKNLGRGLKESDPSVSSFRYTGFVSGCLMYMRRDAINLIGKLDMDFDPMYYEDAAWNYRAHTHALKTIYTPWCKAVHLEGSTAGTDLSQGMKRYQEVNRNKFLEKFSTVRFEEFNT